MRLPVHALVLACGAVISCGPDRGSPTESPLPQPVGVTHVDLTFSSSTPLFTSRANAINDSGVVVGSAAVNPSDVPRAVVWRPSTYVVEFLPDQNAAGGSSAHGIGRDGVIGGEIGCGTSGAISCTPVYWRDGTLHVLDGVGQVNAVCPCDSHTLVGQVVVDGALHGALWIDGVLIDVGTPQNFADAQLVSVAHGFIVGNAFHDSATDPAGATAFRWAPSSGWTRLDPGIPDQPAAFAADVNSSGTAVGLSPVSVIWPNGSNTPTPLDEGGLAAAINDSSVVAGSFRGGGHPFFVAAIWTQTDGWTPIGGEMNPVVTDINNSNQVVGYWRDQGQDHGTIWVP
jgi:hypothetical protein